MTAYNRVDDTQILNYEKFMNPDYVLVIDPGLVFITDICENEKAETKYIITTHLSKDELLDKKPELKGKNVYTLDCIKISLETIGKSVPNAPMLGALVKVSKELELDFFLEAFKKVLGKKLPQNVIDANMVAITRAYNEVC